MPRHVLVLVCLPALLGLILQTAESAWEQSRPYTQVNLTALGDFPFDSEAGRITDVPAPFRVLNGKPIVIEGHMYADFGADARVRQFHLVYGVDRPQLGGPPRVQERILAKTRGQAQVQLHDFYELVRVYGTLHVAIQREPHGVITSLYCMDVDRVVDEGTEARLIPVEMPLLWGISASWLAAILWGLSRAAQRGRLTRRTFGHFCPACGYDMRATPWRCPECGRREW